MDIFAFRDRLIDDYATYISSFIHIRDPRIQQVVRQSLDEGALWPRPLIQLNPSFEAGASIEALADAGVLHDECRQIFRADKTPNGDAGRPLRLHRHQSEAVRIAQGRHNYVLTTGTGSGKSLAYIVPIVNHVLRRGTGKGIQAIVVYPMNALANSQAGELEKFLCHGYPKDHPPVTFARYTGQEVGEERERILHAPPDILLTNYVMLELILTRPAEQGLIAQAQGLQFLVLDELHTYRGRQGADVALLARRTREAFNAPNMQCVGTSATLAGGGTWEQQREEVAAVASQLFGAPVTPDNVIGETLRRATPDRSTADAEFVQALTRRVQDPLYIPPTTHADFVADPLSSWIESVFGVRAEAHTGRLIRSLPRSIRGAEGAARELAALTQVDEEHCALAIQQGLLGGYACERNPQTGFPAFAFRLHQFISKGDTVYAALEAETERHITVYGQQFVPGDRSRILLPLVFCRECGQEYYCVRRVTDTGRYCFRPRELSDQFDTEEGTAGFLYASQTNPWPDDRDDMLTRLPDDWVEIDDGILHLRQDRVKALPQALHIGTDGQQNEDGLRVHFLDAPFRFCLQCGVAYTATQKNDFSKMSSLSSEGRSTATTILSLAAIRRLRGQADLAPEARKLLSFTDNRQDASLQAGHFNDFVEITLLRSALYQAALKAGAEGIQHEELAQKVFQALALDFKLYASNADARFQARQSAERAFRHILAYRLYHDLRRGWRVTAPNLEQCGLLEIQYAALEEVCEAEDLWQNCHAALLTASPSTRARLARTLLDYMRRELAIKVDYLDANYQEQLQQQSSQFLIAPWAIDENEKLTSASILYPRSRQKTDFRGDVYVSGRGGFGQYLRRSTTFTEYGAKLTLQDVEAIIPQLLKALASGGLVEQVTELPDKVKTPGYQIPASAMCWVAGGGGQAFHDPIRVPRQAAETGGANRFFVAFYKTVAADLHGLEAREHTAQVPNADRQKREQDFRRAALPVLYCSPTMELGVDIASLNVVNLRNVPPTPANYAQRSGRAGRSGQPALVFSYCTTGSPHDQYFFKRPERMVSGAVTPPRLDLANEDLVRAHVHAIWLAHAGLHLGRSLKDVLNLERGDGLPALHLLDFMQRDMEQAAPRLAAVRDAKKVLATFQEQLDSSDWYSERWLPDTLDQVGRSFDRACDRWRNLYLSALKQQETQNALVLDASRPPRDRDAAKRLRAEAEEQLKILTQVDNATQSDFYSYRYFASEGFLPGYNFPRLPLSAYIPGRGRNQRDEFLSRSRFLAISEFGPRAIVYHEGSRYEITKVILPAAEHAEEDEMFAGQAKLCPHCGYLHPLRDGAAYDNCERCRLALDAPLTQLFRLQNVSTRRRERINCDEEERSRTGFEIVTGVRFVEHGSGPSCRAATIDREGEALATLTYGHGATLWRLNMGWTRRKHKQQFGFVLDIERGTWAKNEMETQEGVDDVLSPRTARVIPYVEDNRNCLLFTPAQQLTLEEMASLQAALKNAIQVTYQLEDNELAAEPLPNRMDRRHLLLYEAAEGGAGVLRRLLEDPRAWARVAEEALRLCHYDPVTGDDQRRAPRAKEDCEAACYDCLRSYANQRDHERLDRKGIQPLLLEYARAQVTFSPTSATRGDHLNVLLDEAESGLEKQWLQHLEAKEHRLPTNAQKLIAECGTRPDFLYVVDGSQAAIYIDGPPHDFPDRQKRDQMLTDAMEDQGYLVLRFHHQEDWDAKIKKYPSLFGTSEQD